MEVVREPGMEVKMEMQTGSETGIPNLEAQTMVRGQARDQGQKARLCGSRVRDIITIERVDLWRTGSNLCLGLGIEGNGVEHLMKRYITAYDSFFGYILIRLYQRAVWHTPNQQ